MKSVPLTFETGEGGRSPVPVLLTPAANIWETTSLYKIVVAAPGLRSEDFNIEIEDGIITITASATACSQEGQDRREYDYSAWSRSFVLPDDADSILTHARYVNGELVLRIPRGNTTGSKTKTPVYVY